MVLEIGPEFRVLVLAFIPSLYTRPIVNQAVLNFISGSICSKMHNCDNCKCNVSAPSTQQTLDELSFTRGIWTSALNGCKDEVVNFLDIKHVSPDVVDSSGYTALVSVTTDTWGH